MNLREGRLFRDHNPTLYDLAERELAKQTTDKSQVALPETPVKARTTDGPPEPEKKSLGQKVKDALFTDEPEQVEEVVPQDAEIPAQEVKHLDDGAGNL